MYEIFYAHISCMYFNMNNYLHTLFVFSRLSFPTSSDETIFETSAISSIVALIVAGHKRWQFAAGRGAFLPEVPNIL